ncbi:MAG: hypothetical protein ACLFNU_00825 [Bacteroidales bacterium]
MIRLLSIIFILGFATTAPALEAEKEAQNESGTLLFDVSSKSFFDNLEFYNDIQKGYTLTGFNVEPRLAYTMGSRAKISGGFHMLSFFGEETITRVVPVLTIQTQLTPNLTLNIGNVDALERHGMPEPLYKPEREFTHQPEGGFQFLYNSDRFVADAWLNWEAFLFPNDTIQEEFTAGFSGRVVLSRGNGFNVEVPLYAIAIHKGGQINVTDERVTSLGNFGSGINFFVNVDEGKRLGLEGIFIIGKDFSPNPHHVYQNGWAVYPKMYFKTSAWFINAGYWRASEMMLPRGQEIFGSVSTVRTELNNPERELLTGSAFYSKDVAKGFNLTFGTQLYYDIRNPILDFRFSIIARFNDSFLINRNNR